MVRVFRWGLGRSFTVPLASKSKPHIANSWKYQMWFIWLPFDNKCRSVYQNLSLECMDTEIWVPGLYPAERWEISFNKKQTWNLCYRSLYDNNNNAFSPVAITQIFHFKISIKRHKTSRCKSHIINWFKYWIELVIAIRQKYFFFIHLINEKF